MKVIKIIILLTILCFALCNPIIIESLQTNTTIILMGDSILKNNQYVKKGESVEDRIKSLHKNTLVVAQDGAIVFDLILQFKAIPEKYNKSTTKLFISAGGNDILHKYRFHSTKDRSRITRIIDEYQKLILQFRSNCKCEIILCTIYFPTARLYHHYYPIIKVWNHALERFAKKHDFNILPIGNLLHKKQHFTHDIEPSSEGSQIICDNILII